MPPIPAPTFDQIVGANLERLLICRGWGQDDLVSIADRSGLSDWSQPTVSLLVAGKRTMTLEDAAVLCVLLRVKITELLQGGPTVSVSSRTAQLDLEALTQLVEHGTTRGSVSAQVSQIFKDAPDPVTDRLARRIGVDTVRVMRLAKSTWKETPADELVRRLRRRVKEATGSTVPEQGSREFYLTVRDHANVGIRRWGAWRAEELNAMAETLDQARPYSRR